jgi:hypothetical protein
MLSPTRPRDKIVSGAESSKISKCFPINRQTLNWIKLPSKLHGSQGSVAGDAGEAVIKVEELTQMLAAFATVFDLALFLVVESSADVAAAIMNWSLHQSAPEKVLID